MIKPYAALALQIAARSVEKLPDRATTVKISSSPVRSVRPGFIFASNSQIFALRGI